MYYLLPVKRVECSSRCFRSAAGSQQTLPSHGRNGATPTPLLADVRLGTVIVVVVIGVVVVGSGVVGVVMMK